jgi:hypothetical protein
MNKKLIFIALVLLTVISCKKSFDPGATEAVKVANEWWVQYYVNGEPQAADFTKLMTYNTAANNDTIWVDDKENFWHVKFRAKFNKDSLTFHVSNSANQYYESTITISSGKVMPKAAHSKTGVVTDSIYCKFFFSDDPDHLIWEVKGTARTGWAEDDY